MNVQVFVHPFPLMVAVFLEKELFLDGGLPSFSRDLECGVIVTEGKTGSIEYRETCRLPGRLSSCFPAYWPALSYSCENMSSKPLRTSFSSFSRALAFSSICSNCSLGISFRASSCAGRQHFLYFFPEPQGHGAFRSGFGCAESVGHCRLTPRSLIGAQHFIELCPADAVFNAN